MITGFHRYALAFVTNVITDTGKGNNGWCILGLHRMVLADQLARIRVLVASFLIIFMVVVSCFTPAPSKEQVEAITFTSDFKKSIRESWVPSILSVPLVVIGLCAAFYAYFW